ncbi:benzoate 1,2-dioxygenase electron transfer component BenC [Streptomyces ochraceiscleroticus]|uniref:Benzoate 1,2-dioxygenase electron transfer component BenC n=1 Tax=Streptomyces ochraceiscleroticus TaxID=47761 RepID=A0ABW1MNH6_9ACTN|nr:benzoate 1,2-dioxygenase electron transfer component BenC [Streptomyces ochraceiscleroticus]
MSYQVALSFEDGITRFVTCGPDETVADASYKARINIPLDCRDGACGTCKSLCESGSYDGGDYIEEALTDEEAAQGYALPCQMTPQSDLVLRIPTTSDAAKTAAATYGATLVALEKLSETTVAFTLEPDDRAAPAFLPGQYVNVAVPGTDVTRSYSFSSGPAASQVSFLVRLTEDGTMSGYLRDRAQVGDRLEFTGPMGSFYLRESRRPALLLAGGTGLAPMLSMLEKMTTDPPAHPVHLVYGVSTDEDLVRLEALADYAAVIPGFTYDHCVKEYVTARLRPEHLHDGEVDVYVCGPPPMVEGVRTHLQEQGITPAAFHHEKFAPSGTAAAAELAGAAR